MNLVEPHIEDPDDMIDYGCVSLFKDVKVELKELPWMMLTLHDLVEQERRARHIYYKDLELTRPSKEWFVDILDRITGKDRKDYHDIRSKKISLLEHCAERNILFRCNKCGDPVVFESRWNSFHCIQCDRNDRKVLYDPVPVDEGKGSFNANLDDGNTRSRPHKGPPPPPGKPRRQDRISNHNVEDDLPVEDLPEALEVEEERPRENDNDRDLHDDERVQYLGDKIFGAPIVCQTCGTLVGSWYNEFPTEIPTTYLHITCPDCSEIIRPAPVYLPRRKRDDRRIPPPGGKRGKGLNP